MDASVPGVPGQPSHNEIQQILKPIPPPSTKPTDAPAHSTAAKKVDNKREDKSPPHCTCKKANREVDDSDTDETDMETDEDDSDDDDRL